MATDKVKPLTLVTTELVRFSYAHVFEPASMDESQPKKYSVSLIIPKSDKTTIAKINKAINMAKEEGKAKFGGKVPATLKIPLRDGDAERPEDDAYKNSYFVNAISTTRPSVVDKDLNKIIDKDEFYSGCYGRANINFYAYNTNGVKGIACGLNHVQKMKDGEPLTARISAEDAFSEPFEVDDAPFEDDEDLLS